MKSWKLPGLWGTPLGLVIALGLLIAVIEILVHRVLIFFDVANVSPEFADAVLLSLILAPALYFLVFRKLQESEGRFRQVNASAQDAIVMVDDQGRLTDWNPAAQRMFQWSQEEALGQQIHRLIVPARYHADAARGFARFEETGDGPLIGKTFESSAVRKDGSEFSIEHSISAIKVRGRWHAIAMMRDITERKEALSQLRDSEQRYRQIIQTSMDGFLIADTEGRILDVNDRYCRMIGCERGELLNMSIPDVEATETREETARHIQEIMTKGHDRFETRHRRKDGQLLDIEVSTVYQPNEKGRHFFAFLHDITKRKRMEKENLQAGARMREALEEAISAIAATLEQRDPYTAGHQRRVSQLAVAIGEEMGLGPEVIEGIHFGGLIHDIGKISVPAEILGKPGRLTDIEFALIKVHTQAGYEIVKDIDFPWPVADMVHQHHERLDGSGYPQGLKGEQIRLEARILAVADVVEAIMGNRPYRPGLGMDAALAEITRRRGTELDPVAVDACLRVIREKGFAFTTA